MNRHSNQRTHTSSAPRKISHSDNGKCPVYRRCGGCQIQNMSYERQLEFKQNAVEKLLGCFGTVQPIIGMKYPYHYRNKVQAAFSIDRNNRIISGVYQSSTHRIVPIDSCLIEDRKADEIIVAIRKMMRSFKMTAYDERSERGFLRHVLVKRGFATNQIMVVLVATSPIFAAKKHFVKALLEKFPEITTIVLNVNQKHTSMVLGDREMVLYGPGYIEDILCGCVFRISAKSFYQINPVQTKILYETAVSYAQLTGTETVIDAYCGIGTIGMVASKAAGQVIGVEVNTKILYETAVSYAQLTGTETVIDAYCGIGTIGMVASKAAGQVIGVEVNRDAVRDAIANAKRNGIKNIYFHNADAGEFMVQMAQEGMHADVVLMDPPRAGSDEAFLSSVVMLAPRRIVNADAGEFMVQMAQEGMHADVVLMDPPRAGSDEAFLSSVVMLAPRRIVYISCNPQTLARDLGFLAAHGYKVRRIQPVDMFPHTSHIESVVLLTKVHK